SRSPTSARASGRRPASAAPPSCARRAPTRSAGRPVAVTSGTPPSRSARCRNARRRSTSSRSRSMRARTCRATSTSSAPRRPPSRASSSRPPAPSRRPRSRRRPAPSSASATALIGGRDPAAALLPLERALPPHVHVRDDEDDDEEQELDESEPGEGVQDDRERIQEDDLDVEDDEEHRRQVEADREALLARRPGGDAGLERDRPRADAAVWAGRQGERREDHRSGNQQSECSVDQERQPVVEHRFLPSGAAEPNRFYVPPRSIQIMA